MNSWIMRRWLETHKKEEYPDLSITQENDAFHVLPEGCHPSEESIMRMCSSEFFSKHKYKYVESPMNTELDQTFEDCGNPLPSPPYEEPALRQSQACAAKIVARNEDIALAYAYAVNEGYGNKRNPSFSIHNKNQTGIPMGTENQCPRENRGNQVNMTEKRETQSNQSQTESKEQEGDEEDIDGANAQSSDLENNENVIHEEVPKQHQKTPKKALVKDSVNLKNASLTIHDKKPTCIAEEKGYQFSSEHRLNQADLTEKDDTQSYHYWKTELYHGQEEEEEVYEFITPSSNLEHYEKAILGDVPKQDHNAAKHALVKDSVNLKNASLTIHAKRPTRIAKEKGYQFSSEHRLNQADLTEKDEEQSYHYWKTELYHGQEEHEEVYELITPSSDLEHYEMAILGEVPKKDEVAKHALVKDSVNLKNASLTIHDKKPTRIAKEKGYQFSSEHRLNQADLTEKGEEQSYHYWKTELYHGQEEAGKEEVYEFITPSSNLEHYKKAILGDVPKQDQNAAKHALVKDSVNLKNASLTIHDKKPTRIAKEKGYQLSTQHRLNQADLTEKDDTQSYHYWKTELYHGQEEEEEEEDVYDLTPSSDLEHYEKAITPSSDLEHYEKAILGEVPKQDQKAAKKALVKDSVNLKNASLTIHDKKPTRIAKEKGYQFSSEHRRNQADLTEKDEEQSYHYWKTELYHGQEEAGKEEVYEFITPSSDLEHNEKAILGDLPKQDHNAAKHALVKDSVNLKNASLTIHDKKPTRIAKEKGYQLSTEHRLNQADLTEKDDTQSYHYWKTELYHGQEEEEEEEEDVYDLTPSSDLEHYEKAILGEVPKQDQKAAKNALVKDSVNLKNASLTIHDKKPTRIAKEKGYQFSSEHRRNQADLTEKDEEQSYHYWKTELYHGQEEAGKEEVYEFITPSSDLEHYEKAILGDLPKQDHNAAKHALVKDSVNLKNASLTIHDKKPTRIAKEKGYQLSTEHRLNQADLTEKDEEQSYHYWKTELHHGQEEKEEVYEFITPSSDLEHYEKAIIGDVPKQDQKAAKHALVKDSVNLENTSLTIHDKKPTCIPEEKGYQFSSEHTRNQADLTEKDEEQSYHYWKTELYHGQEEEEEVYELITPSSDLEHYEKAITPSSDLKRYEKAILGEVPKQDQKAAKNALVKDSVNLKNASLTIHDKKPTRIAKEKGYQFSSEHRRNQADLTEKDEEQSYHYWMTELHHGQEEKEVYELTTPSSDLEHYEMAIIGDVSKQDQKAAKHALVKDSVNLKNASLTIHDKKPTRIAKEKGYQFSSEHRLNQADLTKKDDTQSYQSRKTKLQHEREEKEEVINAFITLSSDLEHNENAILEEIPKQDQTAAENALVKESVNIIYASLTIHDKKPTGIPEEVRKQEEKAVKHASVKDAETTKCASLTTHDKKPTGISKEARKQDEKAVKNASVEDAETTKYQSLPVHFKELTGVPKERENQCPREHCGYEARLTERGKTESKRSKATTKFQPIHEDDEGDINGCIAKRFRNSEEEQVDANGNLEDEEEITKLEEICNQKQKVSQEGTVNMKYPQDDGSGALRKDTPVTHTLCTDKIKEEDQVAQNLQPVGEGTECKVDHQPSPFRRKPVIRRKTKKKLAMQKANNKQNKENVTPECGLKEVVHDQVLKEVNEEHREEEQNLSKETFPCLPQAERSERRISVFAELAIDISTWTEEI